MVLIEYKVLIYILEYNLLLSTVFLIKTEADPFCFFMLLFEV